MHLESTVNLEFIKNKTGYEAKDPISTHSNVCYLEVIKPLKWSGTDKSVPDLIPIGSLTWCYNWQDKNDCILLEDNRYGINFHPDCFRRVSAFISNAPDKEIESISKNVDKEYRLKTKAEFIDIGKWNSMPDNAGYPSRWSSGLQMNHYIGKILTKDQQKLVRDMIENKQDHVAFDSWVFSNWDFVELKPGYVPVDYGHPEPIQQVDSINPPEFPSLPSTSRQTAPILQTEQKGTITDDDIVIESIINITV